MFKFETIYVILFLSCVPEILSFQREMTVNIDRGREDCFYQKATVGDVIELDYQVIDGGHGDLDITFHFVDPTGRILHADFKKAENNHKVTADVNGDYKFCFDNTFSAYNSKTVFFEITIDTQNDEENENWDNDKKFANIPDEVVDMAVADIKEIVLKVQHNLKAVRHLQDIIKSTEARDRNLAEENYFKVNTFSWTQIFVMMFVGFVQVHMVRSLFDDSSRVNSIWKSLETHTR